MPGWLFWTAVIWLGACIGSFLNVVVYRLPIMMQRQEMQWAREALGDEAAEDSGEEAFNLVVPRSRCPHCGHQVRALENIPIVSWLVLRGRCSACGAGIAMRYPLVEAGTALATCVIVAVLGPTWTGLWALLFTWALIALALIDLDTQLLPDSIVLPLLWLGLLVNVSAVFAPLADAVIGAAIGYGTLWALYWAFKLLTGKEGMGYGDFKLMGAMGAWLGWAALPGVVLLASLTGIVAAVVLMLRGDMERETPMPFGPFIAAAGWLAMVLTAAPVRLPGL
ncbi:MAG: prepilin peptidase [Gammaproteobacteria bacterium]|nr:MAG: prepilin peptidase [Gammaproteobacteria bacterium]